MVSKVRTWERIYNYNLGLDFGFIGNRLTGTFELFMKKITTLTAGILLGMNIALAGGNIPGVQAEEAPSITAIESNDNAVFKVAQLRPDRI